MDELRLDGNAAAGTLGEVFSFEVTTAQYACEGCGRADQIGAAMVYEVRGLGTIVRCPSCDNALIRLAHNRGRHWIDLKGIKYMQVEDVAEWKRIGDIRAGSSTSSIPWRTWIRFGEGGEHREHTVAAYDQHRFVQPEG